MRLVLGLLLASGLYVAAIALPDPSAAAVGGDVAGTVAADTVVPGGARDWPVSHYA